MDLLLETERTAIEAVKARHADALRRYYLDNAKHLTPWEPLRPEGYHDSAQWAERARQMEAEGAGGKALRLVARLHRQDSLVAVCNFTNIARGAFQACTLGYSVAASTQGRGLMHEVLSAALPYVFDELGLHRVMANHLPENERSARLLARLGFEREGYARSYLKIAGRWRDHVLTSKVDDAEQP